MTKESLIKIVTEYANGVDKINIIVDNVSYEVFINDMNFNDQNLLSFTRKEYVLTDSYCAYDYANITRYVPYEDVLMVEIVKKEHNKGK